MKPKIKATYKILNHESGTYYVGSSVNLYKRWEQHKVALRAGNHRNGKLQNSWAKHSENAFVFIKLDEFETEGEMHKAEEALIAEHIDNELCCNLSRTAKAPMLGRKHTAEAKKKQSEKVQAALAEGRGGKFAPDEETRRKMSESLKGNTCAKGYKRTEAEIAAIRQRTLGNQNWLGRNHTEESIAKMGITAYAVDPQGNETEYPSINAMREALNITGLSMILRAIETGEPIQRGEYAGWMFYTERDDNRVHIPEEYKNLPRSRPEALEKGAKEYFTGKPCKHGHVAPRILKGTCRECRRIEGQESNRRKAEKRKQEAAS